MHGAVAVETLRFGKCKILEAASARQASVQVHTCRARRFRRSNLLHGAFAHGVNTAVSPRRCRRRKLIHGEFAAGTRSRRFRRACPAPTLAHASPTAISPLHLHTAVYEPWNCTSKAFDRDGRWCRQCRRGYTYDRAMKLCGHDLRNLVCSLTSKLVNV